MFDKFQARSRPRRRGGWRSASPAPWRGTPAPGHRGQEGAGICSSDGKILYPSKSRGLIADIFTIEKLKKLQGHIAIGHNRYSTTGTSQLKNVQPFYARYSFGQIAVAHNGNLINAGVIREELQKNGAIFLSTSDTEVIIHLMAQSKEHNLIDRIVDSLKQGKGAYSILFLTEKKLIGVRDPNGFRPLILGKLKDSFVLASETCALDLIEAEYIRDIEPGEVVIIDENGLQSINPFKKTHLSQCIFEF